MEPNVTDAGIRSRPHRALSLRLYVAGESQTSVVAIANLTTACREHLEEMPAIEIVDILADPIRAFADGVFVTPLLVRLSPTPVVRIVGDLSERSALRIALGPDVAER